MSALQPVSTLRLRLRSSARFGPCRPSLLSISASSVLVPLGSAREVQSAAVGFTLMARWWEDYLKCRQAEASAGAHFAGSPRSARVEAAGFEPASASAPSVRFYEHSSRFSFA